MDVTAARQQPGGRTRAVPQHTDHSGTHPPSRRYAARVDTLTERAIKQRPTRFSQAVVYWHEGGRRMKPQPATGLSVGKGPTQSMLAIYVLISGIAHN